MASMKNFCSFGRSMRAIFLLSVFFLACCFGIENVAAEPAAKAKRAVPEVVDTAQQAAETSTVDDDDAEDTGLLVIGPSFGRTGTSSTRAALGILGFGPTHHMAEVIENQAFDAWSRIATEKNKTLRQALLREELRGYRSAVDAPSAVFYRDLLEMYPAAKVLMTTRNAESWLKSAWDTILLYKKLTWGSPHLFDTWWGFGMLHLVLPMLEDVDSQEGYKKVFNEWQNAIPYNVPKDRDFLQFSVRDGWGPLVTFLEVPEPQVPFPRSNDKTAFRRMCITVAVIAYVIAALGLIASLWFLNRLRSWC